MSESEFMTISDYQGWTETTAIYPRTDELPYLTIGLVGEAGEIANLVKKVIRDQHGVLTIEDMDKLGDELGDLLWYLVRLADVSGHSIMSVIRRNVDKLEDRKRRGMLHGSGDRR